MMIPSSEQAGWALQADILSTHVVLAVSDELFFLFLLHQAVLVRLLL